MNQLKLLNFHKMIANFANNLVGAFIPLIIYQATNNLYYAVMYLVSANLLRITFTLLFRKIYGKFPQLLLLMRIIPIALYNIFIFLLPINLWIGVVGVCLFVGLDASLNHLPKEIIFNYASLTNKADKSLGITRLFEQSGIIIALVVGGFLLDFNKTLVLVLSLSIYAISVVPLVIFYLKSRKQKTFNKDATSNAIHTINKKTEARNRTKKLTGKLLLSYFSTYFIFAFLDLLQTTFSLMVFIKLGEFAMAGILNAIFNCTFAIGYYVASLVNNRIDMTKLVVCVCLVISTCVIILPFINITTSFIFIALIYGIIGFSYPFLSLFVLDRMLIKSRIMACSNKALFMRETGCITAYILGYSFGFIGLFGVIVVICVTMFLSSIVVPHNEEKTRRNLVDFLQNNEIVRKQTRSKN